MNRQTRSRSGGT